MTTVPTSAIKFSDIQSIMGGSGTVSMSQYLANASSYYSRGVAGVSGAGPINVGQFSGKARALRPGFMYRIFTGGYFADDPTWFDSRTENYSGLVTNMSNISTCTGGIISVNGLDNYSVEWFGYLYATVTGTYTFYTASDDASYIWVGSTALVGYTTSNCIVNNGGGHGVIERSGTISLTAGTYYPIRIQFGEGGGGDDCQVSFSAPGIARTYDFTGYVFFGLGANSLFPGNSARLIRAITNSNTDGVYYINFNGTATSTYCLMNSKWDGGGWMMLMKATRGTTFPFSSTYWTDTSTTLNAGNTNRNDGDAKFNAMNYAMVKDVMALWPDVGYTGGSISQTEAWAWLVNNYYSSGTRATVITGFSTANSRDSPVNPDPTTFAGFSTSIWSSQSPAKRHIFGGGSHLSPNYQVRWGFMWNENAATDFASMDALGGIGMTANSYSSGDYFSCCGVAGLNRSMRVELYGR